MKIDFLRKRDRGERVVLPRTLEGTIFEVVCAVLLLALWVFILLAWSHLPEQIPTHFNAEGEANRYGERWEILLIGGVGTFAVILMLVSAYFPKMINTPIRPSSMAEYKEMARMVRIQAVLFIGLFFTIVANMASVYTHLSHRVFMFQLLFWVGLIFLSTIVGLIKIYALKRQGED